jgi:hypothetical protein
VLLAAAHLHDVGYARPSLRRSGSTRSTAPASSATQGTSDSRGWSRTIPLPTRQSVAYRPRAPAHARASTSVYDRDALAVAKANGTTLGRPVTTDPKTRARVRRLRTNGWSYRCLGRTRTLDSHASRLRRKLNARTALLGGVRRRGPARRLLRAVRPPRRRRAVDGLGSKWETSATSACAGCRGCGGEARESA